MNSITDNLSAKELNVMIVCSNKKTEKELRQILQTGGVRLLKAKNGSNGLGIDENKPSPDLIFIGAKEYQQLEARKGKGLKRAYPGTVVIADTPHPSVQGLEFGNTTYLTEPLSYKKVEEIVSQYLMMRKLAKIEKVLTGLNRNVVPSRLRFSTRTGHVFLAPEEIIYLKADSNYTHVFLRDRKHITVSKSLRTFDVGLKDSDFVRISRSSIININYLKEIDRTSKHCLLHVNGQQFKLPLSGSYSKKLMEHYKNCC
ncbi:MAG: LytTR family DNA-binding domain-containing protein [bacterium]